MIFGGKSHDLSIKVGNITITESTEEKVLGVTLDKQLSFKGPFPLRSDFGFRIRSPISDNESFPISIHTSLQRSDESFVKESKIDNFGALFNCSLSKSKMAAFNRRRFVDFDADEKKTVEKKRQIP